MPTRHIPEEELFRRLDAWTEKQPSPPTLWDVVRQEDGLIAAAYITRVFRKAAKEAVLSHERVKEVRQLALLAFKGDAAEAERFLRAPSLLFGRSPLEATVESNNGMDEALRGLAILLQEHSLSLFDRIATSWSLADEERAVLLGADLEKVESWRSQPFRIPLQLVVRIVSLLMAHKAIVSFGGSDEGVSVWLREKRQSSPFNGDSALALMMLEGRYGIILVRDYLNNEATVVDGPRTSVRSARSST